MPYRNLELDFDGPVATLTLARPEKLNPIDWSTVKELRDAVDEITDRRGCRITIVTGESSHWLALAAGIGMGLWAVRIMARS